MNDLRLPWYMRFYLWFDSRYLFLLPIVQSALSVLHVFGYIPGRMMWSLHGLVFFLLTVYFFMTRYIHREADRLINYLDAYQRLQAPGPEDEP